MFASQLRNWTIGFCLAFGLCTTAQASVFFTIGGSEYSSSGALAIPGTTIDVTLTTIAANQVRVDIDFNSGTNVNAGAKLDLLFLNIANGTALTNSPVVSELAGSDPSNLATVSFQSDDTVQQLTADGSKGWDIQIAFDTNAAAALNPGDSFSFILTGTGLTESSFLEKNSWWDKSGNTNVYEAGDTGTVNEYAAAHLNEINNGKSGWYANTNPNPEEEPPPNVPEPTSLAIWALGMVAAGFGARRMRKQK